MGGLRLTQLEPGDIPAVERLHAESFGSDQMTRWQPGQLERHLEIFPEGQLVVRLDGEVVATASSLLVPVEAALSQHTWMGLTGGGDLLGHDPEGGCLYGMEIMVAPGARGLGLSGLLYRARKVIARRLDLWGIALGGRLAGYAQAFRDSGLEASTYVREVARGKRTDPVLTPQLARGFTPVAVLPNYLRDPPALDHAALMVWTCRPGEKIQLPSRLGYQAPDHLGP